MEEIKASVDVGDGVSTLLTKLAEKIGTSVDQVFPWYINQQVIEGWTFLAVVAVFILLLSATTIYSYKRSDFDNENVFVLLFVISLGLFLLAILGFAFGASGAVSKIINPEYHAVQQLFKDVSRLKF